MLRTPAPLICFSHLRWDFVFQRPQHVISRLAHQQPAYFWEEPEFTGEQAYLEERVDGDVTVLVPRLPKSTPPEQALRMEREMLDAFLAGRAIVEPTLWYYTPMALEFSRHADAALRVYDCMDELSLFKNPPPKLADNERELLARADVVFTGGRSLYEAKRRAHHNVHCFPSSVDAAHFGRIGHAEPQDMRSLGRPRFGFYGVIDERFDLDFVRELATLLPACEFIFIGPVVKIDETDLPRAANVHYLGMKSYAELPAYLEHWDAALLPFARNDATRFISPTKTLEYLAAHKPVVSTPIADVVDPYGREGLVAIAGTAREAADVLTSFLQRPPGDVWYAKVDALMKRVSWNATANEMMERMSQARGARMAEVAG